MWLIDAAQDLSMNGEVSKDPVLWAARSGGRAQEDVVHAEGGVMCSRGVPVKEEVSIGTAIRGCDTPHVVSELSRTRRRQEEKQGVRSDESHAARPEQRTFQHRELGKWMAGEKWGSLQRSRMVRVEEGRERRDGGKEERVVYSCYQPALNYCNQLPQANLIPARNIVCRIVN
ncbi:hypothetical protein B0H19DRAFT_1081467 [Mycena capillaripes]|nr:hypothetical protein B0H19DRAFT_1081467 [Mycena capillaripes]